VTREEILEAAKGCVTGQRQQDYGTPEDSFGLIGKLWTAYLEHPVSSMDVAVMMGLLKIARIQGNRSTQDSFVDLAGYAACAGEIATEDEGRGRQSSVSLTADSSFTKEPIACGRDEGREDPSSASAEAPSPWGEGKELEQLLEVSLEKERKLQEKAGVLEAMLKLLRLPDMPCNICKGWSQATGSCIHRGCQWEQLLEMLGDQL
jgi:hypothetical protein